jgi:hypothetical protein
MKEKEHQKRDRIRDPRSGKNSSWIRIPDTGGKKAPNLGSRTLALSVLLLNLNYLRYDGETRT